MASRTGPGEAPRISQIEHNCEAATKKEWILTSPTMIWQQDFAIRGRKPEVPLARGRRLQYSLTLPSVKILDPATNRVRSSMLCAEEPFHSRSDHILRCPRPA